MRTGSAAAAAVTVSRPSGDRRAEQLGPIGGGQGAGPGEGGGQGQQ